MYQITMRRSQLWLGYQIKKQVLRKTGFNLNAVFEIISGAFSPLIPALAGSGC